MMSHSSQLIIFYLIVCAWPDAKTQETTNVIWKPLAYLNCAPNDNQMILLRIFFSRVTLIEATELLSANGRTTRFSASLVKLLSTSKIFSIKHIVCL